MSHMYSSPAQSIIYSLFLDGHQMTFKRVKLANVLLHSLIKVFFETSYWYEMNAINFFEMHFFLNWLYDTKLHQYC